MVLVNWNEIYSVNIAEVDNQHKKLIELLNNLHEAMMTGKGRDIMSKTLSDLVNYTVSHFATEEKLFDQYDYPETEMHKQQHLDLVEQVGTLQKKFESGEKVLTIDVMNFLRDWLYDHIVGYDKKFGPYLNNKGVY